MWKLEPKERVAKLKTSRLSGLLSRRRGTQRRDRGEREVRDDQSQRSIDVTVDLHADVAYIKLSDRRIARTEEFGPEIMVDLDELNVVVGIELLTLAVDV